MQTRNKFLFLFVFCLMKWINNSTFLLRKYGSLKNVFYLKYLKSIGKSLRVFLVVKQLLHGVWMTDKRMYTRGNTHVPYHPSHWYIEYLTVSKHARLRRDTFVSLAKTSQFCYGEENEKRIEVRYTEIHILQQIF